MHITPRMRRNGCHVLTRFDALHASYRGCKLMLAQTVQRCMRSPRLSQEQPQHQWLRSYRRRATYAECVQLLYSLCQRQLEPPQTRRKRRMLTALPPLVFFEHPHAHAAR